jgi:hypothetical protein
MGSNRSILPRVARVAGEDFSRRGLNGAQRLNEWNGYLFLRRRNGSERNR